MSNLKFAETHNLVAFLDKPEENDGFEGIIDFLNASSIRFALTIQALVDKKKVIVTKTSVRRALQLKDAEGTECLPNATIFEQLALMGAKTTAWNEFSCTMASAIICLSTNQKINFSKYIFDNMVKNLEGGVKFLMYPRRKQRKDIKVPQPSGSTEPITDEAANEEHVPIHSNDPLLSGEDRLKLNKLMELCTNLSQRVLDLENTKTSQAAKIAKLKEKVKKLKRKNKSRTSGPKRLRKVSRTARMESSEDEGVFDEQEVKVEKVVSTAEVTTASATPITVDELTLAQTLIKIKAAKPKAVTTTATTTTTVVTRHKAIRVVVQEPSEFTTTTLQPLQLPQAKDKSKAKMIEPEKPLKKKDQILIDEEIAQKLQAQLNVKLEEEEKLAKQKEEDANIAEWDNVQAMIDADYESACGCKITGTRK
ncbi:hypothetical protein Tco_1492796 [Tanacetum coccineum]